MGKAKSKHRVSRKTRRKLDHMSRFKGHWGVKIGLPAGSGYYPDGIAVWIVGIWNEFGTKLAPPRPWLRPAIRNNLAKYKKFIKKALKRIQDNNLTPRKAMSQLGIEAADDARDMILEVTSPENAPATIAAKGSSNPLIDTALMRQSVTHEVVTKGQK